MNETSIFRKKCETVRVGEGRAHGSLGNSYYRLADFQKAIEYREGHLKISKEVRDRAGEGRSVR